MLTVRTHFHLSGFLIFVVFVCLLPLSACGKKGPLTLASYEKPQAPSLLAAHHREDSVILSWAFPGAQEKEIRDFLIMRSSGGEFAKLAEVGNRTRSFTDADIVLGTHYRYKILSRNLRGIFSSDSGVAAITPVSVPMPPRALSATLSDDSLVLQWEKGRNGVLYNIYRSLTKGEHTPVPLNTVPLSNAHFRDTFFPDRRVYYTVRALTENLDEGPPSEELTVDPAGFLPPAPVELRCFLKSSGIYLYWSEPDSSLVKGFRVYRRFESGKYELVGETQIPFFLDTAAPSRKRDYRVAAKGLSVEGPPTEMRGACASSE